MDKHSEISLKKLLWAWLAGGSAGISVDFVLFPIDSIKTRLQASSSKQNYRKTAEKVNKFRGFVSSMLASFPCAATFWTTYEFSKMFISKNPYVNDKISPTLKYFIAASIAEWTQALIRNPFEVIKQNQQIGKYHTIAEAGRDIMGKRGISGFYSGYLSLIMREIPFSGLQMPLYEFCKKCQISFLSKYHDISESEVKMKFINHAINGAIAGSTAGFIVTPIDVLKTRQMTYDMSHIKMSNTEIIKSILKEDGVQGLFRGAMMRLIYLSFGGWAFFGIYEIIKKNLEKSLLD